MTSYEDVRRRHVEDATAMLPGQIERLGWTAERLRLTPSRYVQRVPVGMED